MALLQVPEKQPDYRLNRDHLEFLCCLSEYWPSDDLVVSSIRDQLDQVRI